MSDLRITLSRLTVAEVEAIDAAVETSGMSRNMFLRNLIAKKLGCRKAMQAELDERAAELSETMSAVSKRRWSPD